MNCFEIHKRMLYFNYLFTIRLCGRMSRVSGAAAVAVGSAGEFLAHMRRCDDAPLIP